MSLRTAIVLLVVLSSVLAIPAASADPADEGPEPDVPPGTCYDIDPFSSPPVYVYECPSQG